MELSKEGLLLLLQVLKLLKFDFVLPLSFLVGPFHLSDFVGTLFKVLLDFNVLQLLFAELDFLLLSTVERLSHILVGVVVPSVLLVGSLSFIVRGSQVLLEELDDVHVGSSDIAVVLLDLLVFLLVLLCTLLNFLILADLDQGDLTLALSLHLSAEVLHFLLVLHLDLIADSLVVTSHSAHLFVVGLVQSVNVLLLTALLFFLLNFERSQVLLQLTFVNPVLVLRVLEGDLRFLLELRKLVGVLEHQVHQSLHVNLDFNLVFLLQVLELPLFVTKFSLLVFELFLSHHPEVGDSNTLVVVHVSQFVFVHDLLFQSTALSPE